MKRILVQTIPLSQENVTLTAYVLDRSNDMRNVHVRPAILIFPGGGYHMCSDREAEPIAMSYLAEGYHAFVLRYSIKQNAAFPRPLNDAEEALELIRGRSQEWGIDQNKIAVCGFSAGGHLAAALGTMGRVKPNALILGYPCILESMGSIFPSPVPGVDKAVNSTTPPAFIFHTAADALVPVENALAFASALTQANVPFEMHIFQNGRHGLSLAKPLTSAGMKSQVDPNAAQWFQLSTTWLTKQFGEFEASWESAMDELITVYSVDAAFGKLWGNPNCRQVILEELPAFANVEGDVVRMQGVPLRTLMAHIGEGTSAQTIDRLELRLKDIPFQ